MVTERGRELARLVPLHADVNPTRRILAEKYGATPVSTVYVDTSALGRVLLGEPDALAIERALEMFDVRVASRLLGDAIHLATARRLAADGLLDAVMTFDARFSEGARHHGIAVVVPS